jgi:hypothetical protein
MLTIVWQYLQKSNKSPEDIVHQADGSLDQSEPRQRSPKRDHGLKGSSKGKETAKDASSASSGSTSSSSFNPIDPISGKYTEVHVKMKEYLKTIHGDKEIIWKGATSQDSDSFPRAGGWYREIRRRGGDLSFTAAIYYADDQRYALSWSAYRILLPGRTEVSRGLFYSKLSSFQHSYRA